MINKEWLPHITKDMTLDARGNNLCSYLIALEGWRRGLQLKWYSEKVKKAGIHAPGRLFSLSNGDRTHYFYKAKGDKVSQEAIRIGKNKDLTKEWLSKFNIPVPKGKRFTENEPDSEVIKFSESLGYPVVLKPTNGDQGVGVIANITDTNQLKDAINYVRNELGLKDIIVETFIEGEEYRLFVIEDRVIAAIKRIPANIVGDGVHTIKELIEQKNKVRKKNPRLYSCLIKIDYEVMRFIKMLGYNLETVPAKGERIFLRENSNVSTGGDSVDVLDELPNEIKELAIKTLKVIPGLPHGGVDIIVNPNLPIDKAGFIIEINPVPQIGSLVFPMIGQPRDVPGALIDYYFPETIEKVNYNKNVYFDFKTVLEPLINKSASEVTVSPPPSLPFVTQCYVVNGDYDEQKYKKWIRKKAIESDLYGFVQNRNDKGLWIVVGGEPEKVASFKNICSLGPNQSNIKEIKEKNWEKPIKVCFEILEWKSNKKNGKKKKETKNNDLFNWLKKLIKRIMK